MKLSVYAMDVMGLGVSSVGMAISTTESMFLIATLCFMSVLLLIINGDIAARLQARLDSYRTRH